MTPSPLPTAAGSDPVVNSEEELAALPPRRDLKPFPMAEGIIVTLAGMALGVVAFLVVYALQNGGWIG